MAFAAASLKINEHGNIPFPKLIAQVCVWKEFIKKGVFENDPFGFM